MASQKFHTLNAEYFLNKNLLITGNYSYHTELWLELEELLLNWDLTVVACGRSELHLLRLYFTLNFVVQVEHVSLLEFCL